MLDNNLTSFNVPNYYIESNITARAITFGHDISTYHEDIEFKLKPHN